jgi:serine protease AprX
LSVNKRTNVEFNVPYFKFILMFSIITVANAKNINFVRPRESPVIEKHLQEYLKQSPPDPVPVWIYFTDKQIYNENQYCYVLQSNQTIISEKALQRRTKMKPKELISFDDIPPSQFYVEQLSANSFQIRHSSRWMNAVSGFIPAANIPIIAALPFIRQITLLPYTRHFSQTKPTESSNHILLQDTLDYGASAAQLEQIHVPELFELGYKGQGIIIGVLDTGFNLEHEALRHIDKIAEYDFIFNDGITQNEPADIRTQDYHGTRVLSVIGGEKSGSLYGPAFNAAYLLAKTEDMRSETPIEEDNWVAAVEWTEAQGVDVISTSLGYYDWYTYQNMDGRTAVTTRMAAKAAAQGIVVCVAAGNERSTAWYYIGAPADADSIVTVGAVDIQGQITYFSSSGPTFDGRIKPEVVACGLHVTMVSNSCDSCYTTDSGTSFSTPLVAGVAALLLQAHPKWTPVQVREALMMTADRHENPDNLYGWGLVNALAALHYQQKGDVTGDDIVNELDVFAAADLILGTASFSEPAIEAADINKDGEVDVRDIVLLINR